MKRHLPHRLIAASMIAASTACMGAHTTTASANGTPAAWHRLVDAYFDQVYLVYNPTAGTSAGLHQYDNKLENYSRNGLDAQAAALHEYEQKISAVPASGLSEWEAGDRAFLLGNIRSQLLTLEAIRPWQKNPDWYSSSLTNSAFTLIERNYA